MSADLLPERAFRKLQWSLVAATATVIIGAFAWRTADAPSLGVPVRLLLPDYRKALKGARFVVGDESQRFCVVEFFDYQCPPCRFMTPKVRALALANKDKAALALQNFPLSMHPYARQLALVACSLNRSDFEKFDPEAISLYGKELEGLLDTWDKRLDQSRPKWLLEARAKLASEKLAGDLLMVDGTPSLFVVDRLKGATYRCPSLKAVESLISGT